MLEVQERAEALDLLKLMLTCNTVNPPGKEEILAQKLQALLAKEKISAELEQVEAGRANLIFTLPGANTAKTLLTTGHLDTVPPGRVPWEHEPFAAEIVGDTIYGRGAADMKSGLAAIIYAIILNKRAGVKLPQNLRCLATCGEEVSSLGATHYMQKYGPQSFDALLVGEPSNGDMLICHKGAAWLEVITHGQTSHGSMPHLGRNAITSMCNFLTALGQQRFACSPHPLLGEPTCSVDMISGGVAVNVVPDSCSCKIDIRTLPGQTRQEVEAFIQKAFAAAKAKDAAFTAEYNFSMWLPSVSCPEQDKILTALSAAAPCPPRQRGVYFYTDASVLIGNRKVPVVIYGPGDDKQAHQPNEHLSLSKYYEAIEVYKNFFAAYRI